LGHRLYGDDRCESAGSRCRRCRGASVLESAQLEKLDIGGAYSGKGALAKSSSYTISASKSYGAQKRHDGNLVRPTTNGHASRRD
jgi:hypothetical protein